MKLLKRRSRCSMWAAALFLILWGAVPPATASELLQNPSFELYDAQTLIPSEWRVLDGNVIVSTEHQCHGNVGAICPGGTMVAGTDTPEAVQTGSLAQVMDLSGIADWGTTNWLTLNMSMRYRRWGATRLACIVEFLPASYNTAAVSVDDPAWTGGDVVTRTVADGFTHARNTIWNTFSTRVEMPAARWVRIRFDFDSRFQENSRFEDGPYYSGIDNLSITAAVVAPESPCGDNLLSNPGFDTISGNTAVDWTVSGRMTAIESSTRPAYAGNGYVANIGGYTTPNPDPENTTPIDHPDPPQHGAVAQLVDMSTLPDWESAAFMLFSFSGHYLHQRITGMSARLEYLPASYDGTPVAVDDAAWEGEDVQTALNLPLTNTYGLWKKFEIEQGELPRVRWVRVRLVVDDSSLGYARHLGEYLGGFDQVCFRADAIVPGDLIQNAGFEADNGAGGPANWHQIPADGAVHLLIEPVPAYEGMHWLGKPGTEGDMTARVYQVIDLAGRIPGWINIDPASGAPREHQFIQLDLGAAVTNIGGTRAAVGLEYLPYSYNQVDGVAWDNPAWQPRQWTSDGAAFTNAGGDAIDLGTLIEDTTVSQSPPWRDAAFNGWIPRVRWLRIRIELDATPTAGPMNLVGIDALSLTAVCKQYGPYSGSGNLPESPLPGALTAPDRAVPGWVGPEGDGISGGYTGQTKRNYINPAFAGFADGVADYSPSGQYIYMGYDGCPECITGRPWNDASWNKVIITLGDMNLDMLADYFGPAPTGSFHPGEITATFNESPIVNGPGPDFATFENGFIEGWVSDRIFGELAYVEVSSNGTDFIRFPTHSLTPKWPGAYGTFIACGVFGMTGKHVNAYGDQWGTPFDLDWIADHPLVLNGTVDLDDIRYVRQVDIPGGGPTDAQGLNTGMFLDSHGNVIFDSWVTWGSGGADLDAVAVLNSSAADDDGDHITNYWDNCAQTANDNQYDTDGDGYGNRCDCDIDGSTGGDGVVNLADYAVFRQAFGGFGPERIPGEPGQPDTYTDPSDNWNADADFNGDNSVNLSDYAIFRIRWQATAPFN